MTKRKNTILVKAPWLAAEWNYPKNGDRTPENTPPQSRKKYGGDVKIVDMNGRIKY